MSPFQLHVEKWKDCTDCCLCEGRQQVVFARGKIPCDILFIGEAPGDSEDVLGQPFVGPAGKLLDSMINRAFMGKDYRLAFTNLVGCFPKEAKQSGDHQPPLESIKACHPRLKEFVQICKPRLLVLVGALAKKHVVGQADFSDDRDYGSLPWLPDNCFLGFCDIIHPAVILRANIAQQGLAIQRCIVTLAQAASEL